ncbi:hypothetical protein [Bacillus sp. AFS017336]|uniref:hypothetical protein n=1 Tax=Bacillus sp. AFS017336 TaxID=2033489 RepID=UPI000BF1CBB3|nr:hypothetical protein [Bacillus sp. AFS017336]PEK98188.1 hypothetical protein CN601_26115 [Bacillus sp. AFS017336]
MLAQVLIGLAVFFFISTFIGSQANIFLLYGIGLTGAGLTCVLFAITVKNNWKGFKKYHVASKFENISISFNRLVILVVGLFSLYGTVSFCMDLPAYINKNYSHLEGIATKITNDETSTGRLEGEFDVTINNKKITLESSSKYPIEQMDGHRFKVNYLPHTEWIINYKIY